jgi:hypothetical protein
MRLYFGGRTRLLTLSLLTSAAAALGGCGMFAAADAARGIPVAAQYNGLADKSVAIVVYTMPATIDEFAGSREEISAFVANQMRQHLPTTRLLNPRDVIEWQNGTINWYGLSETDVGKHFSVDRVLSIHVLDYSTRRLIGYSDLQGHLRAQCKIVETDAAAAASGGGNLWTGIVDVTWPMDRPLDPTQTNENAVRQRVLEMFADQLVKYFYDHREPLGGPSMRER